MIVTIVAALLLAAGSTGATNPVPEAPGRALALEPGPPAPVVVSAPGSPRPAAPSEPEPTGPAPPGTVAALIGGFAVLAGRVRRIRSAEGAIREALQDNLVADVGRGDLDAVLRRIALLSPSEASAAVGRLSDDEVGVWMRELTGWRGGLTRTEQAEYFRVLAGRLSPNQLVRLTDYGKTEDVVNAAIESSSASTQVALAIALWARRTPGDDGWNAVASLVEKVPEDALAAGLSSTNLTALVGTLFERFERYPGAAASIDLEAAHRLAGTARRIAVPQVKAELFTTLVVEATSLERTSVAGPIKVPDLLAGVGNLLRGDARETVADLNHRVDPHANVTSRWVEAMIRHDRLDVLDVILAELMGGPDRLGHFRQFGGDLADPYPNASNLGYYVGAYGRAVEAIAGRAEEQVGLVSRLFALFTGFVPIPGGAVGLPLGPLVDGRASGVIHELESGVATLKQTLWALAKPRTDDGRLWNGAGTSQFQDAWQEVVDVR